MIPSPVIAQRALEKDHLDRQAGAVAANTVATVDPGTDLIDVTVSDADPSDAKTLANGVATAFVSQITHYQSSGTTGGTQLGSVPNEPAYVFQEATSASVAPNGVVRKTLIGALFGLIIAILLTFLLDYLDLTIKSPEELEERLGLQVLGVVPLFGTLQLGSRSTGRSHA
jgi:capsular polysaccharide biosynthesis protein